MMTGVNFVSSAVSHVVMCYPAARGPSIIQRGLQERLLSERWGKLSLHIGKHPLQQDPQSLLEGSTAQDVHGRTERHPDVGSPHVLSCALLVTSCCWDCAMFQLVSVQKQIQVLNLVT